MRRGANIRQPDREAAYRILLRLYPRHHRERYGEEMAELFHHCHARARDRGRVPAFWLATLADVVSNALATHLSGLGSRFGGRSLTVVPAAGSGTLAAGACCAAVCCTSHAVLLGSIGITGAALGTAVVSFRPLILGVSAILVLVAWLSAVLLGGKVQRQAVRGSRRGRTVHNRLVPLAAAAMWVLALAAPMLTEFLHRH